MPSIQPSVAHLDVYQRTPAWVLPHPSRPVPKLEHWLYRTLPVTQRIRRGVTYALHEAGVLALAGFPRLLRTAQWAGRAHIRRAVVDPALADKLTPRYDMGCKRILISNTYYPALAQPDVDVITDRIASVTPAGIVNAGGVEHPVDTIVLATGFSVVDSPSYRLVHGRHGRPLLDKFAQQGAYLGTTAHGFPNLFVLSGPNTGIGDTSLVYMIESQIAYVLDCLRTMRRHGIGTVEVRHDIHAAFFAEMLHATEGTVWASGCHSWYLDDKSRNLTLWPGFKFAFRRRTRRFDTGSYTCTPEVVVARRLGGRHLHWADAI